MDAIKNVNVNKALKRIAEGFYETIVGNLCIINSCFLDEVDYYTILVNYNRGWKLLLLGLMQAEPFARYSAMNAMLRGVPLINQTLLDSGTREKLLSVLLNITVSDERKENRQKAIYLLGELASYFSSIREHDELLKKVVLP